MKKVVLRELQASYTVTVDHELLGQEPVILERDGHPVAVIIPFAEYEALRAGRESQRVGEQSEPSPSTEHPHIVCSQSMHRGEPTIRETAITVRTIIERTRLGETAAQIVEAYPVLTLGQVHDALGYYYDHPEKIENYIRENAEALWRLTNYAST